MKREFDSMCEERKITFDIHAIKFDLVMPFQKNVLHVTRTEQREKLSK